MSIIKLIEQLKAMPEKMDGRNGEGEFVVLNTHKSAYSLNVFISAYAFPKCIYL